MNAAEKRATSLRLQGHATPSCGQTAAYSDGGTQLHVEGVVPQRDGGVLPVGRPSTRTKLAAEVTVTKLGRKLFVVA